MERQRIKRTWGVTIAGVCLLILGVLLAVCMGAMKILPVDIWNGIFHNTGSLTDMMIRDVRLPRVICVLVTGGILGMTGAMMQGVTRNPIAEPSLLGISQGATLFVALLYASGVGATAGNTLLAALLGAFFFRRACTYIYHEKSGKFKYHKITFSGNGNEYFFYGTHFGRGAFVEPVTDGWILGIRWISRGNVAGCKNYFSGRDTGISGSSAPCTEN